jgi:transcription elongation factor GreA
MKQLLIRLQKELKEMEHDLKVTIPEEIAKAAAHGDLSENAEYEAALEKQRMFQLKHRNLKKRIGELAQMNVDALPDDRVAYGAIVTLYDLDHDEELTYQLVMPEASDLQQNKLSVSSPIGTGLLGKEEGEEVSIHIPAGTKNFEIVKIIPYRDTEQNL